MEGDATTIAYYVLYALAYGVSVVAFMMTNIQILRLLVILSSSGYVVYYYGFPAEPLWLDVVSELTFVLVNAFMILYLMWGNSKVKFGQREQFLYENEFSSLSRVDFAKLLKISKWCLDGKGHTYTEIGEPLEHIYYLVSGRAEAVLGDGSRGRVPQGSVIGEVSFRLESPASATVTSMESCLSLRWNQAELRALCEKVENIRLAVDNVLSSHMARKMYGKSGISDGETAGEKDNNPVEIPDQL
jgi:hypothetical protein